MPIEPNRNPVEPDTPDPADPIHHPRRRDYPIPDIPHPEPPNPDEEEETDMGLRVECHAGYCGEEEPRALHIGGRRIEIADIADRWLAPEHRYFKVRTVEGCTCILRHDSASGVWTMPWVSIAG